MTLAYSLGIMACNHSNTLDPASQKVAFGAVVAAHRIKMGLNRERFAVMAGIGASHLCRIERGDHAPSIITVRKLADAFGCTSGELLDEADEYETRLASSAHRS